MANLAKFIVSNLLHYIVDGMRNLVPANIAIFVWTLSILISAMDVNCLVHCIDQHYNVTFDIFSHFIVMLLL